MSESELRKLQKVYKLCTEGEEQPSFVNCFDIKTYRKLRKQAKRFWSKKNTK